MPMNEVYDAMPDPSQSTYNLHLLVLSCRSLVRAACCQPHAVPACVQMSQPALLLSAYTTHAGSRANTCCTPWRVQSEAMHAELAALERHAGAEQISFSALHERVSHALEEATHRIDDAQQLSGGQRRRSAGSPRWTKPFARTLSGGLTRSRAPLGLRVPRFRRCA